MKKFIWLIVLFILFIPIKVFAYNGLVHSATEGLTGTGGDSLDEISCTDSDGSAHDLATGDVAIVTDPTSDTIYFYIFDLSSDVGETSPNIIVPNDQASCSTPDQGEWILSTVYRAGTILSWVAKATTYEAVANDGILADTSGGAWALTLPGTPTAGDTVAVIDAKGTFSTYNLTINRNGNLIQGLAENLIADVDDAAITLVYSGATDGWKLDTFPNGGTDDQIASEVPFTPVGGVSATDVQAAIQEVDSEHTVETSHADVLVDGDFGATPGFMKVTGAGAYSVDTNTYTSTTGSPAADQLSFFTAAGTVSSTSDLTTNSGQGIFATVNADGEVGFKANVTNITDTIAITGFIADLDVDGTGLTALSYTTGFSTTETTALGDYQSVTGYIASFLNGSDSALGGGSTDYFAAVRNADDLTANTSYGYRARFQNSYDATDISYGLSIQDDTPNPAWIAGGVVYGTYVDIDDGDWTTAYSHYVADGSAASYFGPDVTFGTQFTITAQADPTTDADGEVALDTDGWGSGYDAIEYFNGTASAYLVATTATDTPINGQVPKWNTGGTITWEDDLTGSSSLGTNLTSTSNDITTDNSTIQLVGNSEDLDIEFGTNSIDITTDTGVTEIDLIGIDLKDDGVAFVLASSTNVCPNETTKIATAEYTVGTTDTCELYGGVVYTTTGAFDLNLPDAAVGMNFCAVTNAANLTSIAPDQTTTTDTITLDGTALTAGFEVDSNSTAGEVICCSYYSANNWNCISDGWSSGGAND